MNQKPVNSKLRLTLDLTSPAAKRCLVKTEKKSPSHRARSAKLLLRNLMVLLAAFAAVSGAEPQAPSAKPAPPLPTEPPASKQNPMVEQRSVGGFCRTDHTFEASIRITNNLSIAPLSVTPILYMADGTEYPLASVQVSQSSVVTVSVNEALAAAPVLLAGHLSNYGSAVLKYTWRWQSAVIGSIVSLDVPRSLTFTSMFVPPSNGADPSQEQAEGLWWTPFRAVMVSSVLPTLLPILFPLLSNPSAPAETRGIP